MDVDAVDLGPPLPRCFAQNPERMRVRGAWAGPEGTGDVWPRVCSGGGIVKCGRTVEAEAGPGVGDDDAVAWVAGVETDLNGEIDADVADEVGKGVDVLSALIGDAGDDVAVDEDFGQVDGIGGVVGRMVGAEGVGDAAVGDAAGGGDGVAAELLDLVWGGSAAGEEIDGGADSSGNDAERCQVLRDPQGVRQRQWLKVEHGELLRG